MFSTSVNDEKAASERACMLQESMRARALRGGHTGQQFYEMNAVYNNDKKHNRS